MSGVNSKSFPRQTGEEPHHCRFPKGHGNGQSLCRGEALLQHRFLSQSHPDPCAVGRTGFLHTAKYYSPLFSAFQYKIPHFFKFSFPRRQPSPLFKEVLPFSPKKPEPAPAFLALPPLTLLSQGHYNGTAATEAAPAPHVPRK